MKRIMGIDYGTARIGVALSDELQMLAHPAETIALAKTADPIARIGTLVQEKNVERIIVGLPRHMNGTVGASAEDVRAFAKKLEALGCEIRTWDERLSTVAAQMLLQSYLDSLPANQGEAADLA